MQQKLILPPTAEPVSLDQAICHLREDDDSAQVDVIRGLIRAARRRVETFTHRALVRQTWQVTFRGFPAVIELPVAPVRKVSSIQYLDSAGATQTLATSKYQVDLNTSDRALVMPVYGETWPSTRVGTFSAVTVEFIAGDAIPFITDYNTDASALNATAHPLANDDVVQVWTDGPQLPGGLSDQTNYYVVNSAANAFELSTSSGGSPVTMTADGKGTQFAGQVPDELTSAMLLMIGHWYENREQTIVGGLQTIPLSAESLMLPYTTTRF